ncbi:MAG: tyrosine-type recombinase/integrase [Gammaproteobacteria bacterium]|nr:tyrosine-type recombinase/integrase [Gammaproteobacteria bacterium]
MKLTQAKIRKLQPGSKPRLVSDGNTLNLLIRPSGNKSWVQRIHIDGQPVTLGLGPFPVVTLQEARDAAIDNRRTVRAGGDPRAEKRAAKVPTVAEALEKVLDIQRGAWRDGGKSEKQWRQTFGKFAKRIMGRRVDTVDAGDVLAVLNPIWNEKRETARRLKQRIGAVMKWAIAEGYRAENPVDAVTAALPKTGAKSGQHKALPFAEVGAALDTIEGSGAWWATKAAFRFLVLTAARSGEVRNMTWAEIDGDCWIVPGERMKAGREHRVPLSGEALAVLDQARANSDGSELVFPSVRGKPMTDSTMSKLVRENGIKAVPHGFRSSFRDWAAEKTSIPREVAELALAHVEGSQAERAYRRTDYFDLRRDLMQQWADFITRKPGKVVQLRGSVRN